MDNFFRALMHAVRHGYHHEKAQGNDGGANGILLLGLGIVLLPIPIIGLPLIVYGIYKMAQNE